MPDTPRRRYIRVVRQSSLEKKAGFLVLFACFLALAASLNFARERLAASQKPAAQPVASDRNSLELEK